MKLTITSWSFPRCTLEEAAGVVRALGFEAMDADAFTGNHLNRAAILKGDADEVKRVKRLGLKTSNIYYTFGAGFVDRALNTPDQVSSKTLEKVRAAIRRQGYTPNLLAGSLSSNRSRLSFAHDSATRSVTHARRPAASRALGTRGSLVTTRNDWLMSDAPSTASASP